MEKKKLNVKSIKQMCSVPGCANRGSYTIARTRYFGGVNICGDCIREALALIAQTESPKLPPKDNGQTEFVCPKCGKVCKTKLALANHEKACKVNVPIPPDKTAEQSPGGELPPKETETNNTNGGENPSDNGGDETE